MAASKLADIFLTTLKEVYNGEKQIVKALPKMAGRAESPQLSEALGRHLEETKGQAARLERVFQLLGKPARGEACGAINALIEQGEALMENAGNGPVCDAGMIGVSQAIEHYEIARYGALVAWSRQLGLMEATKLLEETLVQEKQADATLSDIALQEVNRKAA